MRKGLTVLLTFVILTTFMVSCKSQSAERKLSVERCYLEDSLYYTASYTYNEDEMRVLIDYADGDEVNLYVYKYDGENKTEETIYSDNGETVLSNTKYEYDKDKCVKEVYTGQNQYELQYQYSNGLKSKMTYYNADGSVYYYCDYTYDEKDNVLTERYYIEEELTSEIKYEYVYDGDNMIGKTKYAQGELVSQTDYEYNSDNKQTYVNTLDIENNKNYKTYNQYDEYGNLIKEEHETNGEKQGYIEYEYK